MFHFDISVINKVYCDVMVWLDRKHWSRGRHGRDRMVVGFITTCAISAYHH